MKTDFQYKSSDLLEEHIKQICRFLDKPYVKSNYMKWHKEEMDKKDTLTRLNCKN